MPHYPFGTWKGGEGDLYSSRLTCAEIYTLDIYYELIQRVRELLLFISLVQIVRAREIG